MQQRIELKLWVYSQIQIEFEDELKILFHAIVKKAEENGNI